jgi:hypothetical protein
MSAPKGTRRLDHRTLRPAEEPGVGEASDPDVQIAQHQRTGTFATTPDHGAAPRPVNPLAGVGRRAP